MSQLPILQAVALYSSQSLWEVSEGQLIPQGCNIFFILARVTITSPLADTTVTEDEGTATVMLTCTATGVPQPSFTWSPSTGARISIVNGAAVADSDGLVSVNSTLTISSLVREDAGTYNCTASNTATLATRKFTLAVNCKI